MNLFGIGGGTDFFSWTIRGGVMIGIDGGTPLATAACGAGAGVGCCPKLCTSFSSEDNRVAKLSTPRFALFTLASATKGRTRIAINRAMMNRTRSSICLFGFYRIFGFPAEDNHFARQ